MKCKFCNFDDVSIKREIKSPHNNLKYSLFYCKECKSSFFSLAEHDFDLNTLYNKLAELDSYSFDFKPSQSWKNQVKIIKSLKGEPKSILDIGSRTGDFLMHWNSNIEKTGVELSHKNAKIAKSRGLKVHEDFIENISFSDNKFDVVSCFALLEHVENPQIILKKLSDIVEKDGYIVILVPYIKSFKSKLLYVINYRWHMFSPPEHLNFFSKYFLDSFMKKNDLVNQKTIYTSGGNFNPFRKIPYLSGAFSKLMITIDYKSPLNKIPIFDHMYLYYKKN